MDSAAQTCSDGWVRDFLTYMSAEKGCSQATIKGYGSRLAKFRRFFAAMDDGLDWGNLDDDIVRRWVMALMEDGETVGSIGSDLTALRSFYRYLVLTKRVNHNPMTRVVSPKREKPLPKFFRDSDINRLLDELKAEDGYANTRAYLIIILLYMTGMRVGELVGLDVEDVDLQQMQVKVTGKRNKQRIIPLADEVGDAVKRYLPLRAEQIAARDWTDAELRDVPTMTTGPLLLNTRCGRMGRPAVEVMVKSLTGRVTTQQKRTPHVFRHTFATSMINEGSDLQSVKEILGHVSLATTQVYTHTNFEELKRIYDDAHPRS